MKLEEDMLAADLVERCDLQCATERQRGHPCRHGRLRFGGRKLKWSGLRGRVLKWLPMFWQKATPEPEDETVQGLAAGTLTGEQWKG